MGQGTLKSSGINKRRKQNIKKKQNILSQHGRWIMVEITDKMYMCPCLFAQMFAYIFTDILHVINVALFLVFIPRRTWWNVHIVKDVQKLISISFLGIPPACSTLSNTRILLLACNVGRKRLSCFFFQWGDWSYKHLCVDSDLPYISYRIEEGTKL